jgi:hypothetical protein
MSRVRWLSRIQNSLGSCYKYRFKSIGFDSKATSNSPGFWSISAKAVGFGWAAGPNTSRSCWAGGPNAKRKKIQANPTLNEKNYHHPTFVQYKKNLINLFSLYRMKKNLQRQKE